MNPSLPAQPSDSLNDRPRHSKPTRVHAKAILSSLAVAALSSALACAQQSAMVPNSFLFDIPSVPTQLTDWQVDTGRGTVYDHIDGATLRAYLYIGARTDGPSVIFFNGQQATIEGNDAFYRSLAALGPTVFVYDYRGYGFSTGTPDLLRFRSDALAIYDNVAGSLRPGRPVIVYGFSMGTALAAYVASQRPVAALVLAAPIASARDELASYAKLFGSPYDRYHLTPAETLVLDEPALVAQSQAPLLVIHSTSDTLVPIAQGRRVFAASPSATKKFLELRSVPHGDTPGTAAALKAFKAFLSTIPATTIPTVTIPTAKP